METQARIICRLCLKICGNFKAVNGDMKDVFDLVLPMMDLTAVQESVMCTNCTEMLNKCFDFKMKCFNVRGDLIPFVDKDTVKLDLLDVCPSKNKNVNGTNIPENRGICVFCNSPVRNNFTLPLDVEERDVMLDNMIKQCFPELDLNIKESVICAACHGPLESCVHFIANCLIVEEKIKKYCKTVDINGKGQIELSSLLQFAIRDVTTNEKDINPVNIIKIEKEYCEEREQADEREISNEGDIFKLKRTFCEDGKNVKLEVEHEVKSFVVTDDLNGNSEGQFTPKKMSTCKDENNDLNVIKTEQSFGGDNELNEESLLEMEDQKFLVDEEIDLKKDEPDFFRFEDSVVEGDLSKPCNKHQSLTHKNVSKTTMHQCDWCSYQSKNKCSLEKHLLQHKDPSKVTMYRCDSCLYQSKRKDHLKRHLLLHMNPSKITMYPCEYCPYQAKNKYYQEKHLLEHKDPSEVTIYRCDDCSYQTTNKCSLKVHLLQHTDPSEVQIYKCDSCLYQTKRKDHLKRHLLLHKNPSEVTMYSCTSCSYQTKYLDYLKSHLRVHKDPSEVTTYKCDSCPFVTKLKVSLKKHLLVHKDPSEITMYECDSCSFSTRQKYNLKIHSLIHKNLAEMTMYKCEYCLFQTKYKHSLQIHCRRQHKDIRP